MTVGELVEHLEEIRDRVGADAPVRIAFQPEYPLRASVANVTAHVADDEGLEVEPLVWIAATASVGYSENPYAPRSAWEEDEER
jgi:hypothetical protein